MALCSVANADGDLIAYESFESPDLGLFDGKGDQNWANANNEPIETIETIVDQDLSYTSTGGGVSIDGGSQSYKLDQTGDNGAVNSFTFTEQSGDVYFSFLARLNTGGHFFQAYVSDDADTKNSASVVFDTRGTDDVFGRLQNSIGDTNGRLNTDSLGGSAGSNVWVIGKLWKSGTNGANYDKLSVNFNPTDYTENWDATIKYDIEISAVDTFGLRTYQSGTNDISYIDEIRIGTTFASVIPEPGTYALLAGLAGLTFVMLRRRR